MESKQKHTNCTKCGGYLEPLWKRSVSGVCGKCRNLPVITAQAPFCTKHTPGPWRVKGIGPANQYQIGNEIHNVCYVEDLYNARLIAAAPDLLQFVRGIIARAVVAEQIARFHGYDHGDAVIFSEGLALIKKATQL